MVPHESQAVIAAEGADLRGTLFQPSCGSNPVAFVVLNGATGVPARFYGAFARWLSSTRNIACLTYDYRDFGASGDVSGSPATMVDWGIRDQQAARDWVADQAGGAPLWVIGHSLGAMMLSYQKRLSRIDRVVSVASGAVHLSDHPWPTRLGARVFWAPGLVKLSRRRGRFPASTFRMGADLPAGVYAQWRLWCTSPEFHRADPDLPAPDADDLTCPMKVVAVSDDVLCPPKTVWRLMAAYPEAFKRQLVLRPEDHGLKRIGHIDVLSPKSSAVWPRIVAG